MITGWVNYYRCAASSKTFNYIDHIIFQALQRWGLKRHANKGKQWIVRNYYRSYRGDNWRFSCLVKGKNGLKPLYLKKAADTHIRRHIKIVANANPFDPDYKDYFIKREKERKRRCLIGNNTESAGLRIIQPYEGLS